MNTTTKKTKPTTGKTIGSILLALVSLVVCQILASLIGTVPVMLGAPTALGNLIAGILYPVFCLMTVKILCVKFLKLSLEECKLPKFSLKPVWCIAAVIMPCIVSAVFLFTPGHFENNSYELLKILEIISGAVFFYGIGTGIVEEVIFCGVIMTALEHRFNKSVAILVPSVLFGLLHIVGRELNLLSIIQLMIAGSIVGILFSLVTYESKNVWNSAMIHAIWNMVIIGGILNIGVSSNEFSIYNYVLETDSFLITGGDFGIEASVISIIAYVIFIVVALVRMKKKK